MRKSTRVRRLDRAIKEMSKSLEELPIDEFDMKVWGRKRTCGTAACGVGTLSLIPYFQKRGLQSEWRIQGWTLRVPGGWLHAVSEVFGITVLEADELVKKRPGDLDPSWRTYPITKDDFVERLRFLRDHYAKTSEPLFWDEGKI